MKSAADLLEVDPPPVPKVPVWARPRGEAQRDVDASYMAGAALSSLDNLVGQAPLWVGVWRQRLALKSAGEATRLLGRKEEVGELRDGHYFREASGDPGPSGRILLAWRRLSERGVTFNQSNIGPVAELLGIGWDGELTELLDNAEALLSSARPAPLLAAEIAAECYRARPDAELLAFWLADAVLARKFRWMLAVPLLMGQVGSSAFKAAETRRRIRPGEEGWARAVLQAYARAATDACDLAVDLAERTSLLVKVIPKLRAKGATDVIQLLLDDDAVPGSWSSARLSSRGARRLFERLVDLGAARELTGRPTFRLYGL